MNKKHNWRASNLNFECIITALIFLYIQKISLKRINKIKRKAVIVRMPPDSRLIRCWSYFSDEHRADLERCPTDVSPISSLDLGVLKLLSKISTLILTRKHQHSAVMPSLPKLLVPSKDKALFLDALRRISCKMLCICNVNSIRTKSQIGRTSADVCNVVYRRYLDALKDTVRSGRMGRCTGVYRTCIGRTSCGYRTGIGARKSRNRTITVRPSSRFRKGIWRHRFSFNVVSFVGRVFPDPNISADFWKSDMPV